MCLLIWSLMITRNWLKFHPRSDNFWCCCKYPLEQMLQHTSLQWRKNWFTMKSKGIHLHNLSYSRKHNYQTPTELSVSKPHPDCALQHHPKDFQYVVWHIALNTGQCKCLIDVFETKEFSLWWRIIVKGTGKLFFGLWNVITTLKCDDSYTAELPFSCHLIITEVCCWKQCTSLKINQIIA